MINDKIELKVAQQKRITDFLADNQDFAVFIADPITNTIAMGYKDKLIVKRIVDKDGKPESIVHDVLTSRGGIPRLKSLMTMVEVMFYNLAKSSTVSKLNKMLKPKGRKPSTIEK